MINAFFELLRNDGSIIINKTLSKNIGLNEAIIYGELISRFLYFKKKSQLTDDGFFFSTVEDLEDGTTLNDYMQRKAINNLKDLGLIETELKGVPPKRYFKLIESKELLTSLLTKKTENMDNALIINSLNFKELNLKNLDTNNTKDNNTKVKETNNIKDNVISKNSNTSISTVCIENKKLFDTKIDKKKKKMEDIKLMIKMTEAFSTNPYVVEKLKEYFNFRVNRGLQSNQWRIILDDLAKYAPTDNEKVSKINNALAGSYMQFIPAWEKDKSKPLNRFDNVAESKAESIVGMNKTEKQDFMNNLNKDADGRLKGY